MDKYSVMMIDDNKDDRYLLKRAINKLNVASRIFEEQDGLAAMDFLQNYDHNRHAFGDDFPPTLIFLDINMPIMNGLEFLESFAALRDSSALYHTSILIMFTSSEREEDKQKISRYPFVKGFLNKSDLSPETLQTALANSQIASVHQ